MGFWKKNLLLLAAVLLGAGSLHAQRPPRVLILGDRIYEQTAAEVAKGLKDRAEVVCVPIQPGEVRNTTTLLKDLDRLLGQGKWDLIHFNSGLGDLVYRAPGMESFRVLPREAGGVRAVDPELYARNLQELVGRLKKTGATLIWTSTTPIARSSQRIFEPGSEVEYNRIAAKVMAANGVTVNDVHAYVSGKLSATDFKRLSDPFEGNKQAPLAPPVMEAILAGLH